MAPLGIALLEILNILDSRKQYLMFNSTLSETPCQSSKLPLETAISKGELSVTSKQFANSAGDLAAFVCH